MAFEQQNDAHSVPVRERPDDDEKSGDHATAGLTVGDGKPKKLSPAVSKCSNAGSADVLRAHATPSALYTDARRPLQISNRNRRSGALRTDYLP